jgi:hypothetical protein
VWVDAAVARAGGGRRAGVAHAVTPTSASARAALRPRRFAAGKARLNFYKHEQRVPILGVVCRPTLSAKTIALALGSPAHPASTAHRPHRVRCM